MKNLLLLRLITLSLLLFIGGAYAYSFKVSVKEMTKSSDLIIRGNVLEVESKVEKNGAKNDVFTYVKISVSNFIKGDLSNNQIIVKMLGGKTSERFTWTEEYTPIKKNEDILLFLNSYQCDYQNLRSGWKFSKNTG